MTGAGLLIGDPAKLQTGIRSGVSYEAYAAIPAMNYSLLKFGVKSMAHLRHEMLVGHAPTEAMEFGQLLHTIVFEPDLFDERYVISPGFDRRYKDENAPGGRGKQAAAAFEASVSGREVVSQAEVDMANDMGVSLRAHPTLGRLAAAPGFHEVVAVAVDPATGIPIKCRIDKITVLDGTSYVLDGKSARDASVAGFSKAVANLSYHQQAALYLRVLNILAPRERRFIFAAIEKTKPYVCQAFELCGGALKQGEREIDYALVAYKAASESGYWPGYSAGIEEIDLPKWAQTREDDDE